MRRVEISPKRKWAERREVVSRGQVAAFRIAGERAVDEACERGERPRFACGLAERKLAGPVGFDRVRASAPIATRFGAPSGQGAGVRRSGARDGSGNDGSARWRRQ